MIKTYVNGNFLENSYIISNDLNECIVIDPGQGMLKYLPQLGGKTVLAVLLTHGHLDHIDGIGLFNCPIYIGKKEIDFLKNSRLSLYQQFGVEPSYQYEKLTIREIKDLENIQIGNFNFRVYDAPGHTTGSIIYEFEGNKLFVGDTLFKGGFGRTDFPTGNMEELKKTIIKILNQFSNSTMIYPGHGETTTVGEEKKNNQIYLNLL